MLVSETEAGRVIKVSGGKVETVLDSLQLPHGLVVRDRRLTVVDVGTKELIEYDMGSKARRVIASNLPVGSPPGVKPHALSAIPPLAGAMGPFTGLAAGADGTLYLSADAEGSVLALRPV